jgi:hypothetical protein
MPDRDVSMNSETSLSESQSPELDAMGSEQSPTEEVHPPLSSVFFDIHVFHPTSLLLT